MFPTFGMQRYYFLLIQQIIVRIFLSIKKFSCPRQLFLHFYLSFWPLFFTNNHNLRERKQRRTLSFPLSYIIQSSVHEFLYRVSNPAQLLQFFLHPQPLPPAIHHSSFNRYPQARMAIIQVLLLTLCKSSPNAVLHWGSSL